MSSNSLRAPLIVAVGTGLVLTLAPEALAKQAPVKAGVSQVQVTLTSNDGGSCVLDSTAAKAGPVTFSITNKTAAGIGELEILSNNRILGEKENLAPGLPTVSFTLTLDGGAYQIYCPGAAKELQDFKVAGKARKVTGSTQDILADGVKGYAHYVDGVVDAMVTSVKLLKADIDADDLEKAKVEYAKARPFYERIESDVDGFVLPNHKVTDNAGNLDYLVDMRESNLDPAVGWHGFHAIERDLFEKGRITDETKKQAAELQTNVEKLDKLVSTLEYKPEDLANGAAGLLEEVQTNKISGEEESYSHIDLVDFAGNVEGAEQAFAFLQPGMQKIDTDLTKQVNAKFDDVKKMLEAYRDPHELGGYKRYTAELKASDASKLSKAIQALQEPLSRIAEKVATAH